MARRKAFRPAVYDALEDRIALSTAAAAVDHQAARAAEVQSATTTPASPSYDELTTTYANGNAGTIVGIGKITGTTETEYRLTVPTGSNTTTTTDSITLPGSAGHETVVNVSTTQGNTTTQNITTTLPDGTITTKSRTQVKHGDKSVFNASLDTPGVGIQTTKGTIIHTGQKTITNETITTAGGKIYHFHRIVTRTNPLESSSVSTTTGPSGAVSNQVKSTTTVTPLPLPAS
jgi:hypothetical protein